MAAMVGRLTAAAVQGREGREWPAGCRALGRGELAGSYRAQAQAGSAAAGLDAELRAQDAQRTRGRWRGALDGREARRARRRGAGRWDGRKRRRTWLAMVLLTGKPTGKRKTKGK